jgi:EAL domain-containing protein (putative c-di-GMP-specific phosphodiesterase class I)
MAGELTRRRTDLSELREALGDRDVRHLRLLDGLVVREHPAASKPATDADLEQVTRLLDGDEPDIVFQRIDHLGWGWVQGFEALARFRSEPRRPPDVWFARAHQAGIGVELELKAAEAALAALPSLPPRTFLSVNVSATTLVSEAFAKVVASTPGDRVVIEVTEHEFVEDYEAIADTCGQLRTRGFRVAVDDAGSGYAGLAHIVSLAPDVIKLDAAITRDIDTNVYAREMVASVVSLARFWKSHVVAEGIETEDELATLRRIGVDRGQGYLLGRPRSLADVLATCGASET